ncbi:glutathione S-transferase [Phakopsora pachyrhizi]|uniref:Glutathione S-transferase n=1 Tax=Phakopsora pachyrhizi TaxID=170000 RepID=A0AAV0AW45_PHAPC|nr:glutathione S-transferase [Phakopsora pachyrhizi]
MCSEGAIEANVASSIGNKHEITQWASKDGRFRRLGSEFRDSINERGRYPPERGRYHLYVSLACPWAHRTLIVLKLKGLQSIIGVSVVHPHMGSQGWSWSAPDEYDKDVEGVIPDPNFSLGRLKDLYLKLRPDYDGRFTVPVLFDTKQREIVNNESGEIIRMFNGSIDLYPENLRRPIDEANSWIYDLINNGVYKTGFATSQEAYDENLVPLFKGLDRVEKMLNGKDYLIGERLTEADVRLFTTIVRFDTVYVQHFKCNLRSIRNGYPNIHRWLKDLYWNNPAFKETTSFIHIKTHYFTSHPQINPTRVIPKGPLPLIEDL